MTFFNLPHIFVVFPPGAGGNFVSGILTKIINDDLSDILVSSSGNAHANSISKLNFFDVLSCGLLWDQPKFISEEEKLQYYKAEIERNYQNDTNIKVSWSHDFSNISLYKTLFPNCKILAITYDSNKEKLAALIQQELKNRLDPNGFVFLEEDIYLELWRSSLYRFLIKMLGDNKADIAMKIARNFMSVEYKSIVTFSAIRMMLLAFGQRHLVENIIPPVVDYFEYCYKHRIADDGNYTQKNEGEVFFIMGPKYHDCITADCIIMPYSVLMDADSTGFLKAISNIVGELNIKQIEFAKENLNNYRKKQPAVLMDDPKKYYFDVAKDAYEQLKLLKET